MPVFGKGRTGKPRRVRRDKLNQEVTFFKTRKYYPLPPVGFTYISTPLQEVEQNLRFPIRKFLQQRRKQTGQDPHVLDWGCGTATAISQLGKNSHFQAYGLADESHVTWARVTNAKLVMAPGWTTHRYFKPNSFDLVYSHYGWDHFILHLLTPGRGFEVFTPQGKETLKTWLSRLKIGGKWVFNVQGSGTRIEKGLKELFKEQAQVNTHNFRAIKYRGKTIRVRNRIIEITRLR